MKRRSFLKTSSLLAAPLIINGLPVSGAPHTGNKMLDTLAQATYGCGKILVIVQMNGGNDGLNTIFPMDKYAQLQGARSNMLMPYGSIATLNNNPTTGIHPAMPELKNLYNEGKLMIVQGVSYANPSFSHFRATDIWFSASGSSTTLDSGWLGRELDTQYPGFPSAFPSQDMPDPLAIQIGSTQPFSLQGPAINMGYNVTNPTALLNVINGITDPAPNNDYGRELSFLRLMKDQSNAYRTVIQNAYNVPQPQTATYPTANSLGDQLKIVARLINGGLKTPVYIVNHPNSHDTHEGQVATSDFSLGLHANILGVLSKAIGAFQADLGLMSKADKVTGMTFSEFGRRVKSNGSVGTDHGTAAPVMFFGAGLNTSPTAVAGTAHPVAGMIGVSPTLPATIDNSTQLPMQFDFRQLYASVMQDWLCLSASQTDTVLGSAFTRLPIFAPLTVLPVDGIELSGQYFGGEARLNYRVEENPKFSSFAIEFSTNGINFTEVKRLMNTSINATESYLYTEVVNAKRMYYRIAAKEQQGAIKYSNIVMLRSNKKEQMITVFPNPVTNNTINVKLLESQDSDVDITILSMTGAKLYYNRFVKPGTLISFSVPPFTANAHYVLQVAYGSTIAQEQIMFR
ncbi:MAG: DUF1501 domain-containing protein [Ferruginibacter sp.]